MRLQKRIGFAWRRACDFQNVSNQTHCVTENNMHVAQIPIIRKQPVSSRLQHTEPPPPPRPSLIHTWAEITTGRTLTIPASCKSCLWASLRNCAMEQWSTWQVVFQVTHETILQHNVMACQHSWAWNGEGCLVHALLRFFCYLLQPQSENYFS